MFRLERTRLRKPVRDGYTDKRPIETHVAREKWVKKNLPLNVKVSVLDPISKLVRTDLAARNQEGVERG
jgi:hypothetical protein